MVSRTRLGFRFLKHHKKFDMARVCKFRHPILRNHYFHRGVEQEHENKTTKTSAKKRRKKKYFELEPTLYKWFKLVKPKASVDSIFRNLTWLVTFVTSFPFVVQGVLSLLSFVILCVTGVSAKKRYTEKKCVEQF